MKTSKTLVGFFISFAICGNSLAQTFSDDFSNENIGDFPTKWDLLQGTAQVEHFDGSKVIKLGNKGTVAPLIEGDDYLSDKFTLEVDLHFDEVRQSLPYQFYYLRLWSGVSAGHIKTEDKSISFRAFKIYRYGIGTSYKTSGPEKGREYENYLSELKDYDPVWRHLTVDYDQGKLKLYIDGTLVLNIPRYEFNPTMISIEGNSIDGKGELVKAADNFYLKGIITGDTVNIVSPPSSGPSAIDIGDVNSEWNLDRDTQESGIDNIESTTTFTPSIANVDIRESIQIIHPDSNLDIHDATSEEVEIINIDPNATKPISEGDIQISAPEEPNQVILAGNDTTLEFTELSANSQLNEKLIDKFAKEELILQNLPGLSVGVYKEGVIDLAKGYGHLYLYPQSKTAITKNTVFRWASISKTLTAVAALQLWESNESFHLNDHVVAHFPYFGDIEGSPIDVVADSDRKKQVKALHLITNTSGLSDYGRGVDDKKDPNLDYYDTSRYETDGDNFNSYSSAFIVSKSKLAFDPGTDYLYSSFGFNILGCVIDQITGSYPNFIKNNIKDQLDLSSLNISNGTAIGFTKKKDGIVNSSVVGSKEWVLPAGGWESNMVDLMTFGKAIINDALLDSTATKLRIKDFGSTNTYRRGVMSINDADGNRIYHNGTHSIVKTLLYMMPEDKIVVGVMIPAGYADEYNLCRKIVNAFGIKRNPRVTPFNDCKKGFMGSSDKEFVGVWAKTNGEDVVLRRGYTMENFASEWKTLSNAGYYLRDLDYSHGKWHGIFQINSSNSRYAMYRNYKLPNFLSKTSEMSSRQFFLYDLETYTKNGVRYWAGLYKKQSENSNFRYDLSTTQMANEHNSKIENGYRIIDVEVYKEDGELKWAGIWSKGEKNLMNRNLSKNQLMIKNTEYNQRGYYLIDLEVYDYKGTRYWAGIWQKSSGGNRILGKNWCDFLKVNKEFLAEGFELMDVETIEP